MKILAIETSCDDTGIAILEKSPKIKILADFLSSQNELHAKYGGVHPSMAKREHEKNILPLLEKSLKKAHLLKKRKTNLKIKKGTKKILERYPDLFKELEEFLSKYKKPDIDKIAVTIGPGLEPCLYVGINFAKALALNWNIEIIPVNHIEAHILVNFLKQKPIFPSLCFVISGGNTKLFIMEKIGKYKELGSTRDDAIGECFDKTARILGLPYPGGPEISKRAKKIKRSTIILPRPMIHSRDYDFSFSGLKTAVLYLVKDKKLKNKEINEICFEIESSVSEVILKKLKRAINEFSPKALIIGGGVSSNERIVKELKLLSKKEKIKILTPKYTSDNAVMIGAAAILSPKTKTRAKIEANSNLNLND